MITDCETRLSHLHRTPWTDETLTDFCSSKLHSRQRDKNPNHFSFFFKLQQNKPPIIQMMQKTFKKGKIFQVPETLCVCNGHCLKTMRVINGIINQILFLKWPHWFYTGKHQRFKVTYHKTYSPPVNKQKHTDCTTCINILYHRLSAGYYNQFSLKPNQNN